MGWSRRRMLEEEEEEEEGEVVSEEVAGSDELQVTWDGLLPRGSPRVLVVEGDDSTRQIIAALLRKCNYKVAAVSDGSKAWEILKEKPQGVDLVLTELELPSISGLGLLTMIMDHETCKNIPVIMMSSHDSISMVYKCMLKGAADFLVKPIRRNELRNLWQHVWRRHSLIDSPGGTSFHQDGNLRKRKHEYMSEKEENLSGYAPSKNKKCSEKGSNAESSCTRSDMEAESKYRLDQLEHKQTTVTSFSLSKDSRGQNAEDQIQLNGSLAVHEGQSEGKATMLNLEAKPSNGKCMSNEVLIEEERTCALVETTNEDLKLTESVDNSNIANDTEEQNNYQDTPLKEAINLIGVMENQPENGYGIKDYTANERNLSNNVEIVYGKDVICKSSSMPHLDLSLRRYQPSSVEEERGQCGTLKHSGSSAFSQYNSRTTVPTTLTPNTTPADSGECLGTSTKVVPDQGSGTSSGAPSWYGTARNMNIEAAMSAGVQFPTQNGKAIKCSPLRVIPLSNPVRGMTLDSSSSGYGQFMIPMFYQQSSANLLWNNIPSMWQQVDNKDTSDHPVVKDVNYFRSHQSDDQSPMSTGLQADQMQEANLELRDEQVHVSSLGDSGSSNMCNGTMNQLNNSVGGKFCNTNNGGNSCNASAEVENEVKKLADMYRSSQREAALNKFRMKRKDRCFAKKVRYQSRKKLAEQRLRVKGQFVRHVQPNPHPTEVYQE